MRTPAIVSAAALLFILAGAPSAGEVEIGDQDVSRMYPWSGS